MTPSRPPSTNRRRASCVLGTGPLSRSDRPLRLMGTLVESPFLEDFGINRIDEAGALELELRDQCRVLNEPLIVLRPSGRQFLRRSNWCHPTPPSRPTMRPTYSLGTYSPCAGIQANPRTKAYTTPVPPRTAGSLTPTISASTRPAASGRPPMARRRTAWPTLSTPWIPKVRSRALPRLFYIPPTGSEACSPTFTPDATSLFMSVQHPGELRIDDMEDAESMAEAGTSWPDFGETMPARPSLVVLTKRNGGVVGS